jgi:hypothetical protein
MASIVGIIESVNWTMKKSDVKNVFRNFRSIGEHPSQNAIGFETEIEGIPAGVICYFHKRILQENLAAINIALFDEPQPVEVLANAYDKVYGSLVKKYGEPRRWEVATAFGIWALGGNVLTIMINDGIIGLRYGDPKVDGPSRMAIGVNEA